MFEHQAGARQDGHSRFPAPRPEGGLESSGPLVPGHGRPPRSTPLGRRGPDQRTGSGGGPAQRAQPGLEWLGVGMRQDLRTPQPTPQAPRASTPTLPVTGMSWKPFGPRAWPGSSWSGVGGVWWRAGVSRLVFLRRSCTSSTARPARRGAACWPDLQIRVKGWRQARLLGRPTATASVWLSQFPRGGMCFPLYNLCLLLFQFNLGAALIFCISSCHRSLGLSMWCLG